MIVERRPGCASDHLVDWIAYIIGMLGTYAFGHVWPHVLDGLWTLYGPMDIFFDVWVSRFLL